MVGWHHQLDGREFEEALGDGDGQGGLACYTPWGRKESVLVTERVTLSIIGYYKILSIVPCAIQ